MQWWNIAINNTWNELVIIILNRMVAYRRMWIFPWVQWQHAAEWYPDSPLLGTSLNYLLYSILALHTVSNCLYSERVRMWKSSASAHDKILCDELHSVLHKSERQSVNEIIIISVVNRSSLNYRELLVMFQPFLQIDT